MVHQILLKTEGLSTGYVQRKRPKAVASELDLELAAGEFVCLLGPNGAGKSTLIRTLAGMQPALGGAILIQDSPLEDLSNKELSRVMGVVLSERVAATFTVFALVGLGRYPHTNWMGRLSAEDEEVVRNSLDAVGALPLISRHLNELSDGERQKVMIARALAQETPVLILDEPTAFLDLPRRVEVMHLLQRLAHKRNKAVLCSTHDLDLALRCADTIWLLTEDGGCITGAPEDLALDGSIGRTFEAQGMEFDLERGSLNLIGDPLHRVLVSGEGVQARWVIRAIERIGYEVVTSADHNPAFSVVVADGVFQLTDHHEDKTSHSEVASLIKSIRCSAGH